MNKFIKEMELHTKSVIMGIDFAMRGLAIDIYSRFKKDKLKVLNKAIYFMERGHLKMSLLYKEVVENDLRIHPGFLEMMDDFNELCFDLKRMRSELPVWVDKD